MVLLEIEKSVVEGAGAAAWPLLRAQEEGSDRYKGKRIGLVLTGGNIDPLMLGELIERGMVRAGRLARIRVDLRDLPGALAHATKLIADAQPTSPKSTTSALSPRCRCATWKWISCCRPGHDHIQEVIEVLNNAGFAASNHDH